MFVDNRSIIFLQVMIAIGAVAVLAFVITLIARALRNRRMPVGAGAAAGSEAAPPWYEFILGMVLLLLAGALIVWQFVSGGLWSWGEQSAAFGGDNRAITFFVVMIVVAGLGVLSFLVFSIARTPRREGMQAPAAEGTKETAAASAETVETPSSLRLLGLLLLAVGFLLMAWIYLPRADQYVLVLNWLYPASLAVAVVLLFDKASRKWNIKGPAASFREWLLCDAILLLQLLAYLNLRSLADPTTYANVFWDTLQIALFFIVFWLLDRKVTRFRFLFAYAYFIALPILLVIWQAVQGIEVAETISWWSTIWPFLIWSVIFFVLEIVVLLVPDSDERQALPAIKDSLFVVVYAILLIVAIPEAVAAG
jgi:hypothetical protein